MIKNILRIAITICFIGLIFFKVGLGRILSAFQNLNFYYFFPAILLAPVVVLIKGYKWWKLAKSEEKSITFLETFRALLFGFALSIVTPAKAGELGRVLYLKKGDKFSLLGLVIIDKFFDFLAVGILSFFGAVYFLGTKAGFIIFFISLTIILLFLRPKIIIFFLSFLGGWVPFKEKLKNIALSLNLLKPFLVLECFFWTLISFLVMTFQFFLFLKAFGFATVKIAYLTYPLILLTNLIPLTIGNLGVREGASLFLLGHFGINSASAVNSAFLIFLFDLVFPGIIGVFWKD